MYKIISFKICPCYQRISALFEAMDIRYESQFLKLGGEPSWFLELSPDIEPVLQLESGEHIVTLKSILSYLEQQGIFEHNGLAYFKYQQAWCDYAVEQYISQCIAMRSDSQESMLANSRAFRESLEKLEDHFIEAPSAFFSGYVISDIDLAWLPVLHRIALVKDKTGYDFLSGLNHVRHWQQRVLSTGIASRSVPLDFNEIFDDFYLNKQTYLGSLYHSL